MNTLIANQYGRVQGEARGCGLTSCVTAQTPRRESVELQSRVDSIERQLHLLAILRAVGRRIEQFQLRESKAGESAEQRSFRDHLRRRGSVPLERFAIAEQHLWELFSVSRLRAGGAGPAYRKPGATLVDLRMFDPNDRSSQPRLVFRPEKLRELGITEAPIDAPAKSDPQGFLLFDDLPHQAQSATGLANSPTT